MTTPCLWFSRGEPQAKLLGTLSFDTFFGVSKESINKGFKDYLVAVLCVPKEGVRISHVLKVLKVKGWIPVFTGMTGRMACVHLIQLPG